MKKNFTLKKVFLKKQNWLLLAMFGLLVVFGCYEFKLVDQPTEGTTNSAFEVNIVMTEDADDSNDWTDESGDLADNKGLFGVLLPEGWTITDNIAVRVEAADSLIDGDGVWHYPTVDHSGDYVFAYDEDQTAMLNDSTPDPPPGYYWWGAKTTENVDLSYFDSLYFTVEVLTDDQVGTFYLQYAAGDEDDPVGRSPYDKGDPPVLTDPLPITIADNTGVNEVLNEASLSVYPNPSYGYININLAKFNGTPVEMMMYDMRGKQVMSRQLTSAKTLLDLVDMAAGAYVIRLEAEGEVITKKFVKN
jgi:hypothetical protein